MSDPVYSRPVQVSHRSLCYIRGVLLELTWSTGVQFYHLDTVPTSSQRLRRPPHCSARLKPILHQHKMLRFLTTALARLRRFLLPRSELFRSQLRRERMLLSAFALNLSISTQFRGSRTRRTRRVVQATGQPGAFRCESWVDCMVPGSASSILPPISMGPPLSGSSTWK